MNSITAKYLEDKAFYNYLYKNLTKQTRASARNSTGTSERQIANLAIIQRWSKSLANAVDDASIFIAEKKDYIEHLRSEGLSEQSFTPRRDRHATTLCTAFLNWMIDRFRHMQTGQARFENSIITLEPEKLAYVENIWETEMIKKIEADTYDTSRILRVERAWEAFEATLTGRDLIIWSYLRCPLREQDRQEQLEDACEELGIKRRMFFRHAEALRERAKLFLASFEKEEN